MDIGYNSDDELPVDKSPVDKLLIDNIKKLIQGLAMEIDLLFRICPTCPPVLQIKGGMSYQEYFDITKNIWDQMIKPTCKYLRDWFQTNNLLSEDPGCGKTGKVKI